jgi:hypothetical protein
MRKNVEKDIFTNIKQIFVQNRGEQVIYKPGSGSETLQIIKLWIFLNFFSMCL